jgi:nitrogen fixation protein FixH
MLTEQTSARADRPKEVTGRMVLGCLVAFFVVVAGINAVMIGVAISTFGGVETASAYQAGLAFAREASAVRAQDARRWQVRAKAVRAGDGALLVEITARDAADRPLGGLDATGHLAHPTDKRADRILALSQQAPGLYRATSDAGPGQWDLVIEFARDGVRQFRSRNRIVLR